VIIADTGGILALLDADDKHHPAVLQAFEQSGDQWLLPWAILPEVDYLASKHLGSSVAIQFADDIVRGAFRVEGYREEDMKHAVALQKRYPKLQFGLVDGIVMAQALRLRAPAIVTLDARHFRAVSLKPQPKLIPLDSD
jgi:uncharacterized protein